MTQHLLFDTETLGAKRENVVVLTMACVVFSFDEYTPFPALIRDGFYVKFSVPDQIKTWKRTIEPETVAWWKEQSKEAREAAYYPRDDDASMVDGLDALSQYIKASKYDFKKSYVWSRGNAFDFPKIESMFDQANIPVPYNGWRIRDVRTYVDILTGVDNGKYEGKKPLPGFVAHNALHDAARDAYHMQEIFATATGTEEAF